MEKAEHRWHIVDGSIAVAKAIVREEAAPQLADEECMDKILRLIGRGADEDFLYAFCDVLDLQCIFHIAGPTACGCWHKNE